MDTLIHIHLREQFESLLKQDLNVDLGVRIV